MSRCELTLDWLMQVKAEAPNLSLGQLVALLQAARTEGLRMSELAEQCGESLSTTSRYVRAMTRPDYEGSLGEAYGLLELQRAAGDGRVRHVVLTEDGAALVAALEQRASAKREEQPHAVRH